jgi:hypothetical protein
MKVAAAVLAVALLVGFAYSLYDRQQSTAEIDKSLEDLRLTLKQAESDDAVYSGGLIKGLIAVRVETIEDTIAMLEQKRQSLLHRVCLNYQIAGTAAKPASADELQHIQQDLAGTQKEIERARAEDAMYSGGLIKGLIAMRIATEQETLAELNQHYLLAKYGLSPLIPSQTAKTTSPARPVVPDKDAL